MCLSTFLTLVHAQKQATQSWAFESTCGFGEVWKSIQTSLATIQNKRRMWKCLNSKCVLPSFCDRLTNFQLGLLAELMMHLKANAKHRPACLLKWGSSLHLGHRCDTKVVRPRGYILHVGLVPPALPSPLCPLPLLYYHYLPLPTTLTSIFFSLLPFF